MKTYGVEYGSGTTGAAESQRTARGTQSGRRFFARIVLAVAVGSTLVACSTRTTSLPEDSGIVRPPAEKGPYVLGVGDELIIKFYGNEELDQEVVVRPDGMISLPYVDEVRAAGSTPAALDRELTRRYTGELANPVITVIVATFAQQRIYVGGEVGEPGVFDLQEQTTLYQALQEAGGLLETAHEKQVLLIRRNPVDTNQPIIHVVDVRPLIRPREHIAKDPLLEPYDVVFVPRSKIANVNIFVDQYIRKMIPVQPWFLF